MSCGTGTFQIAYMVLRGETDVRGGFDWLEEVNQYIALGLGFTVHPPSNMSYYSVTEDPDANPYRHPDKFKTLPNYVEEFEASRVVAPAGLQLSLRQNGKDWVAVFLNSNGVQVSKEIAETPARAIVMAALAAHVSPQG